MIHIVLALVGAVVSVLAFPPFGPGWLVVAGISLFFLAIRQAADRREGLTVGLVYGVAFFGGLMWWLSKLGIIAVIPLVLVQAAFLVGYAYWLSGRGDDPPLVWFTFAVGGWALMEMVRYRFPVGGLEWGAAGYALSDASWSRGPSVTFGTTGLTILVVMIAAWLALLVSSNVSWPALGLIAVLGVAGYWGYLQVSNTHVDGESPGRVIIVQGSTPCPYETCPPDERLGTFQQHLDLTRTIAASGDIALVVWPESSTGSTNADPVLNAEIGEAIGAEARRLGAWFLVGTDRPLSEEEWVNANVVFNPAGEIVGEYRKQHPVPFGEYIPLRPLFDWIPALSAVPRDMIRGDGPVVFDQGGLNLGSVISFEGGFSRYAREHVIDGASMVVVATNEGSYETTPAADQFIGMTRMRATELGVQVVHAAVTGKSVFIDENGGLSEETGFATMELLDARIGVYRGKTPYARYGDVVIWTMASAAFLLWVVRRWLVGSPRAISIEEDEDVGSSGEPVT